MDIWGEMEHGHFEQLVFVHDPDSGLKAVIAIHNTTLGPALGGCRMWAYPSEEAAVQDALRLARSMTYKSAAAGLAYGGGKAVILAPPASGKREAAFRAFGRAVQGMGGRYITGLDLGTTVTDMDRISDETDYVTDISGSLGAVGDFTAKMTAYGVFLGIKTALEEIYGSDDLNGRTIAVQGMGKVGYWLCRYLSRAGVSLIITDTNEAALRRASEDFAGANPVSPDVIHRTTCDIFAPCAIGGILNDVTLPQLNCKIVAGAANNQLVEERIGAALAMRGILYAPDYIINAGGIIVTAAELASCDADFAERQVERIRTTLRRVFASAKAAGITPGEAADRLALQALAQRQTRQS
ncbi:Glu/Leu/Phe/Val dehydrogenase family protein [Gorillibacterium massiliense]|uniref:Glu/Leu/Phe/Val dehydrogenase family protein n=1 Tax=Gorillibacterium massiliense TaxID=1280390 RepID=UPI0004AD9964|nr:Glu/Leu/Phe/Val dehydrogenase family protein [Gorillibacterium massiliense]